MRCKYKKSRGAEEKQQHHDDDRNEKVTNSNIKFIGKCHR